MTARPDPKTLVGKNKKDVPMSCQRVMAAAGRGEHRWVGPAEAAVLGKDEAHACELAHRIMCHLAVRGPSEHQSGHPGGPLSSFTFAYLLGRRRDPAIDQPLRFSAGHLSLLAYGLEWLLGHEGKDERLQGPEAIIKHFRTASGLPGHVEAGIGTIPFGTGPLGKGVSNALGAAFGLKYLKKPGVVDVLLADGDCQEGQVAEAFRLASRLKIDNLVVHGDFNDVQLSDMPSKTVAADFAAIAHAEGWHVIEVQNGNDPAQVNAALRLCDELLGGGRPVFICYYTTMGHGISFMEEGSDTGTANYHGSPLSKEEVEKALKELPPLADLIKEYAPFQKAERKRFEAKPRTPTDIELSWGKELQVKGYARAVTAEKGAARKDFGATHLLNLMKCDNRIVVLHADLAASGGFDRVQKSFPDRVINVGVAEANMAMMAAGLRQAGLLPVTYTFAAFGTNEARANARLIDINCAHTRCAVLHDCTHAGLSVGEDGETHQEQNYLNLPLHHTQVWMPADSNQAAAMAERAMEIVAAGRENVFVFSGRSGHPQILRADGKPFYGADYRFEGRADVVFGAGDLSDQATILATGIAVHDAIAAAKALAADEDRSIRVRVLNVARIRPIDAAAVIAAALETFHLIVVEDHNSEGGLATQVADVIADFRLPCSLRRLGLTQYFPSASDKDLKFMAGLDPESIAEAVRDEIAMEVCGGADVIASTLFGIGDHLRSSRFRLAAEPLVARLTGEKGYLEALRKAWEQRACPPDRIPSADRIRERLGRSFEPAQESA